MKAHGSTGALDRSTCITNSIRVRRTNLGYTQEDVARICGLSFNSIGVWETGKHYPRLPDAIKLARFLGTTVEELWPNA